MRTTAAVAAALALSGPARTRGDLLVAMPIFALVFLLAFDRGVLAKALHASWLMRLGEWSFGIYMVHYLVITYLSVGHSPRSSWPGVLIALTASIVLGALAHRFIEQPAEGSRMFWARAFLA